MTAEYLGVAQMVARYLGVVEAAGSNPVTQTSKTEIEGFPFSFFAFMQVCLKSCVFVINEMGLFFPALRVEQARFLNLIVWLNTFVTKKAICHTPFRHFTIFILCKMRAVLYF